MFPNTRTERYFRLYEELLNFSGLSWWIIDLEDNPDVFYCNKTMCDTFYLDSNLIQHSVSKTCPIAGDYNKNIAIQNTKMAKNIFFEYNQLRLNQRKEYCNRFPYYDEKKNEVLFFSSRAKALVRDQSGKATLLFGIIEPEVASVELYKQASIDCLTGLKNRREFDAQLTFLINLARRENRFVSLVLCDIDHFKQYNDLMGHYAGDECLVKVASSISGSCARSTDVVCRYGGEEFAVISYGDEKDVSVLAEDIRKGISSLKIPHPGTDHAPVTLSVGYVSVIPKADTTPKSLIEKADLALYQAKEKGRNQCVRFQPLGQKPPC